MNLFQIILFHADWSEPSTARLEQLKSLLDEDEFNSIELQIRNEDECRSDLMKLGIRDQEEHSIGDGVFLLKHNDDMVDICTVDLASDDQMRTWLRDRTSR